MVKYIEKIIESVTGFSFDFVDKSGFALADEYIEELELSTIGKSHIPLFRGSFEQAKREAAEQTALLCLFMIPSINHPLRSEFEKSIFCSEKLCEFWNEKPLIALAMDATTPEGYSLVQKMNIGSLPTISLLVQTTRLADSINVGSRSPDKWAVILRAEGLFTDSWLKDRLEMTLNLLTVNEIFKNERQRNLSSDQQIREEQDIAYLKSLEADAAKKRERERREALEAEALNLKLEKERSLEEKKNNRIAIVSEIESRIPKVTDFQSGTKISVQLLNGNRYLREFSKDSVCSSIYDWAYCVHFEDLSFDNFDFERNQFRLRLPLAAMDETMETRDCTNSLPDSESITLLCAGIRGPTKLIVELSSADDGAQMWEGKRSRMCVLPSISLRRKKITTEVLVQNLKTHIIHLVRCEREHLCNKFVQFGWEECRKYLESNHQNLKSIKLGHNCITSINQLLEIDILSNLSDLDLSYNNIFLLPSHISVKIPQMKRLRVEGNQLTELPRLPPSLVTLIVGSCIKGNQIKNLDLSNLILLKVLYADNNILQRLPLVAHSPVLEILSLSHNQISKLCTKDALPSSVEFIDLSHNLLSNIDEYFFWPKSLNFLNLSNNNLRQIRRDSMARVPILCRLFLSGNDLDGAQTIEEARDYSFFKPKSSKECQKLPMDFDSCKFNKHCSLFELSIKSQSLQLIEDQADFSAVKFNSSRTSILDGKSSENYDYQRLLKKYKDGESSKQYDCEPKEPYQRDHTNRGSQIENDLTSIIDFESTENHHHYDDSQLPPIIECCLRSGKTCANCPVRFFHDYKSICSKAIIRGHPDVSTIERVCSPRCWADLNDG